MSSIISHAMLGWFVREIEDNKGRTADRYSVEIRDGSILLLSNEPHMPHGISQWSEGTVAGNMELDQLDAGLRDHILSRLNEAYTDFVSERLDQGCTYRDAMRDILQWSSNGRLLDLPPDFDALISDNAPRVDAFMLEQAGQMSFAQIADDFELSA